MDSLVEKEILEDAETFRQELTANEDKEEPVALRIEKLDYQEIKKTKPKKNFVDVIAGDSVDSIVEPASLSPLNIATLNEQIPNTLRSNKKSSNDTHYSPTDPDARMSVKPGKATAMNYLGEISVDTGSHVITHAQVFTAEKHDSQCLAAIVTHTKSNL
jgi:hypothetical protein